MPTDDRRSDSGAPVSDVPALLSSPELEEGDALLKQLRDRTVLGNLPPAALVSPAGFLERIQELEQRFESLADTAHRILSLAAYSPHWPQVATAAEVARAWRRAHDWAVADPERFTPPSRHG